MLAMIELLKTYFSLRTNEKGQDLAEYGLLIGVIALIVIVGAALVGTNLLTFFNGLATTIAGW